MQHFTTGFSIQHIFWKFIHLITCKSIFYKTINILQYEYIKIYLAILLYSSRFKRKNKRKQNTMLWVVLVGNKEEEDQIQELIDSAIFCPRDYVRCKNFNLFILITSLHIYFEK